MYINRKYKFKKWQCLGRWDIHYARETQEERDLSTSVQSLHNKLKSLAVLGSLTSPSPAVEWRSSCTLLVRGTTFKACAYPANLINAAVEYPISPLYLASCNLRKVGILLLNLTSPSSRGRWYFQRWPVALRNSVVLRISLVFNSFRYGFVWRGLKKGHGLFWDPVTAVS